LRGQPAVKGKKLKGALGGGGKAAKSPDPKTAAGQIKNQWWVNKSI